MKIPALRSLDVFPLDGEDSGQPLVCLRDPTGLVEHTMALPRALVPILSLFDGKRDVDGALGQLRASGIEVEPDDLGAFVERLDQALFLDSPRFHAHRHKVEEAFRAAPVRAAAHAGRSYEGDGTALAVRLREQVSVAPKGRAPEALLIAPHIDFGRGSPVYAAAYGPLAATEPPDVVVIFGTDHAGAEPFTLTRKSYDTPLGRLETDQELVGALAAGDVGDLFADELHHRSEHSIELQAVWLRHIWGTRTPPALPVLCGSLGRWLSRGPSAASPLADDRTRAFLERLASLLKGRRTLVIAGADLAHMGPRFGDMPLGDTDRAAIGAADRQCLEAACRGDSEAFFRVISGERDARRVCGVAPIHAALALLEIGGKTPDRPGVVLGYDQCDADEQGTSLVSIAAVAI